MKTARVAIVVALASLLVGCAATSGTDYTKIYDRKYNEVRLVNKGDPGSFVGTSAAKPALRAPGQHP